MGCFKLEKTLSETRIVIHSQIRLLETEERVRKQQNENQQAPDFLGDMVDKDDLMRRLSEQLDDERYLKMFALFYVTITKEGEEKGVVFQCKSLESDLIIEYVCTIPAKDVDKREEVLKTANLYRGVESMMLDDNYRIGLNEYLKAHTVDEDLCSAIEHLAVVLRKQAIDQVYIQMKEFALASLRS